MATKKAIKKSVDKPATKASAKPATKAVVKAPAKAAAKAAAKPSAYAAAGVNIALGDKVKHGLKATLKSASRPEVLAAVGGFGGLFDLSKLKYKHPVLVSSVDGVGTKLKLAFETGNHECVGQDIVNHCVNDIAVMGAEPLFFLDYIGLGKLDTTVFDKLIAGMKRACQAANCALIGGETAQMPGFYQPGEYDLVGCIIGIVEKKKILSGAAIRPGDLILGMASNGLHTNGYSLARKIIFEQLKHKTTDKIPGTKTTFGQALLQPHLNYSPLTRALTKEFNDGPSHKRKHNAIHGLCHITGGGFSGNLPRILPKGCGADIHYGTWPSLPIFDYIKNKGGVEFDELHEVFNMGIGMCLVVSADKAFDIQKAAEKAGQPTFIIGEVTASDKVRVVQ
jgi:phosphoribosylformylglycinamidine cyclo-ligase